MVMMMLLINITQKPSFTKHVITADKVISMGEIIKIIAIVTRKVASIINVPRYDLMTSEETTNDHASITFSKLSAALGIEGMTSLASGILTYITDLKRLDEAALEDWYEKKCMSSTFRVSDLASCKVKLMPTPLQGSSAGEKLRLRWKRRYFETFSDHHVLKDSAHWFAGMTLSPVEVSVDDTNPNVHNFYLIRAMVPTVEKRKLFLWMFNDTKPYFEFDKKTVFTVIYSSHQNLFAIVSYRDFSVPFLLRPDEDSIPWDGRDNVILIIVFLVKFSLFSVQWNDLNHFTDSTELHILSSYKIFRSFERT
jgi:hypothetical protein